MDTSAAARSVGRPKGEPSTVVNLRLPVALVEKLDRYADRMTTHAGPPVNRATIARQALADFLAHHAPELL